MLPPAYASSKFRSVGWALRVLDSVIRILACRRNADASLSRGQNRYRAPRKLPLPGGDFAHPTAGSRISAAAGAYSAYREAETERAKANNFGKEAIEQRAIADAAKVVAEKAALQAEADKKEAVKQKDFAELQTKEAIAANKRTEEQRNVAEANAELAKANEKRAEEQRKKLEANPQPGSAPANPAAK